MNKSAAQPPSKLDVKNWSLNSVCRLNHKDFQKPT